MGGAERSELALIVKARRVLATEPARTLVLLEEHARRFARGELVQERELLAIEAELALGRRRAAVERARAFADAFPDSAYRRRIDARLRAAAVRAPGR